MSERIEQNLKFVDTAQNLPHPEILSISRILCVYKGSLNQFLANSGPLLYTIFFEEIDFAVLEVANHGGAE